MQKNTCSMKTLLSIEKKDSQKFAGVLKKITSNKSKNKINKGAKYSS